MPEVVFFSDDGSLYNAKNITQRWLDSWDTPELEPGELRYYATEEYQITIERKHK